MNFPTCESCEYWEPYDNIGVEPPPPKDWGQCTSSKVKEDMPRHNEEDGIGGPISKDFGCIHHSDLEKK